jgi:hypothetical protein
VWPDTIDVPAGFFDWIFDSKFKALTKYEINKETNVMKVSFAKLAICSHQRSKIQQIFLKIYEISNVFKLVGYVAEFCIQFPTGYPASKIRYPAGYKKKARLSDIRHIPT